MLRQPKIMPSAELDGAGSGRRIIRNPLRTRDRGHDDEPTGPSEAVREAVTMALYVGVVLAAEFVAVEEHAVDEPSTVAVIWGTALGVALAHVFAFNLAARLFAGGRLDGATRRAVWAQLASAATVAFVVTVPFIFLALGPALEVSGFLLAALIGVTAYVASREAGARRIRSLVDGVIALAVAIAIVSVKVGLTGH